VTLLQILVVLAVVAAVAAVAAGVLRGGASDEVGLPEATSTLPALRLPAGRFTGHDLEGLRFSIGFRGYRMDEVDQVLDRLAVELRDRDAEVAELRERLDGSVQGVEEQ
jgi:DivIVA domain-containing protein